MSTATAVESAPRLWSEEPSKRPNRRRIRARIGGAEAPGASAVFALEADRGGE